MMEELELGEEWFEDTWKELEQARGEVVLATKKKRRKKSSNSDEIILVFEDTDSLDIEETYIISIKAPSIQIGKNDAKNGKFKSVGMANLKENRFLEYIAWQDNESMDTHLTMAFEKGYIIEISGETTINKLDKI